MTVLVLYIFVTDGQSKNKNSAIRKILKQEKEEKVEVKQLLKDERTHKIAGSIFLLLAFLFFIAFTSYLFTWDEDQDKVFSRATVCYWHRC